MMLARRISLPRGFFQTRLPQPRDSLQNIQCLRRFSQNSPLRIISQAVLRPQLPYLHNSTAGRIFETRGKTQNQLIRFMSSEDRQYYQSILKKGLLLSATYFACLFTWQLCRSKLQTEVMERKFPAPSEWEWAWRFQFAQAEADQIPNENGRIVDWTKIAIFYLGLLQKLEDPTQGGKDLHLVLDSGNSEYFSEGVSKAGVDLSNKSEPWRRGYHACLMGAAKALEHLDGWVADKTRNIAFPPEFIIGPSNPNPRPVPPGAKEPPLEENCEIAFPAPEPLYIKILTSNGFTSRQRLEAAVAYADWLDFKGLSSTAEEIYDWGLDIAMGALPVGVNNIVDIKTGVINSEATYVSSNILTATTALAQHHARNNNLSAALPIFISILRARRHLLLPDSPKPKLERESLNNYIYSMVRSLFEAPPYPPPPPTGDEVPLRTPEAICEEATVMSHIGEILFASSSFKSPNPTSSNGMQISTTSTVDRMRNFQSGLSWTRDAVDVAEETVSSLTSNEADPEARRKCMQCLSAGIDNWSIMIERMLENEKAAKLAPKRKPNALSLSFFWRGEEEGNDNQDNQSQWEGEAKIVDSRYRWMRKMKALEVENGVPLWMSILGKTKEV